MKKKVYDLYGLLFSSLEEAGKTVERLLDITFRLHDSDYLGGDYLRFQDVGREHFTLQCNFHRLDQDWMEPDHQEFPFLLYVNETLRPEEIRNKLVQESSIRLLRHKVL